MKEIIKVGFTEQSKAVVTNVQIEQEGENINKEKLLQETEELFIKAQRFATQETSKKLIAGK